MLHIPWFLGTELRLLGFCDNYFYPLSHFASLLAFLFF